MKKFLLVIGVALGSMATAACSQQTAPVSAGRVITKDAGLSPVYASGKCRFKTKLVAGQTYSHAAGDSYMFDDAKPVSWGFPIHCHAGATRKKIDGQLGLIQKGGHILWSATKKPFIPKQHFHLHELKGVNWTGRTTEYSMLWGGENAVHAFNFCISELHGPQVLCGSIQGLSVAYPKYNKKREQAVLGVIKTIVFVKPQEHAVKSPKHTKPMSH